MMTPPRPRRGYALLLTLVLLAIAATALGAIGRRSFRSAIDAQRAQDTLQRKWAQRSLEDLLLPQLGNLVNVEPAAVQELTRAARTDQARREAARLQNLSAMRSSDGTITFDLQLTRVKVSIMLADEQSKINVNSLAATLTGERLLQRLRQLMNASGQTINLALRPIEPFDRQVAGLDRTWPAFIAYEQLLPPGLTSERNAIEEGVGSLRSWVTLWGDGRVNVRHASRPVLEAALADLPADAIQRVITARTEHPGSSLEELLTGLGLKSRIRRDLSAVLTDVSRCASIWTRMDDGQRTWEQLIVSEVGSAAGLRKPVQITQRVVW